MKMLSISLLAAVISVQAQADSFQRIASWPVHNNLPSKYDINTETSSEIITASKDGKTLIYSDSPLGSIGFVDISKADDPKGKGVLGLGGEPTSVVTSKHYVYAGVNTSESYNKPSGLLAAINIKQQKVVYECGLGGQPDSVAVSKDEKYLAVAVENERDEDLKNGQLPQLPAGNLVILPLVKGVPQCEDRKVVELTGLSTIGGNDPEPEFVDFNDKNEIVVTLQENNHLVVVNAITGRIINHFSAGAVDLHGVDVDEERAIRFTGTQLARKREPDAVKWLDNDRFVTANEGDYEGGSRGFTIFSKSGDVLYESGLDMEYRVIAAGHYPDKRSGNKGIEPEGLEVAKFGKETYIFVLAERAGMVGVYRDTGAEPEFVQLLPSGIAPEGAIAIPSRNLFITGNEKDLIEDKGPRSHVMIYQLKREEATYPQITAKAQGSKTIGWGALSGLVADPKKAGLLYAINDSFYRSQPTIFTIDATRKPAQITHATPITRDGMPAQKLDMEGITTDGKGGFWIASEGKTSKLVPHAIYHVNQKGEIQQEIPFPAELLAVERRFGSEGITRIGDTLWIAIQRNWQDDPVNTVKLVAYNIKQKTWGAVRYPTEQTEQGWVGLSEITAYGNDIYLIERDNQIGDNAKIKRLYRVAQSDLKMAKLGTKLPLVKKKMVHDFLPDLKAQNGYVTDKIEGFAIDRQGYGYAVTDNDGVDDSSGETLFFSIGKM
ncbi:esterase-like activity of phytase family protein [Marinomonas agarivorans]|nr:esterase-like activity of phytase family protein [Marinomonas agarivorans]